MAYFQRPEQIAIAPKRKAHLKALPPMQTFGELRPGEVVYKHEWLAADIIELDNIVDRKRARIMGKIVMRHVLRHEEVQPAFVAASLENQRRLKLEATDGNHRITGFLDFYHELKLPTKEIFCDVSYGLAPYDILYAKITAGTSINAIKFARNMRWLESLYKLTGYEQFISLYQAFVMTWQKQSGRNILAGNPELATEIKGWVDELSTIINREVGTISQYLAVMEVASPKLVEAARVGSSYAKGESFINIHQLGLIAKAFPHRRGYPVQEVIFNFAAAQKLSNDDIRKVLIAVKNHGSAHPADVSAYLRKGSWKRTVIATRHYQQPEKLIAPTLSPTPELNETQEIEDFLTNDNHHGSPEHPDDLFTEELPDDSMQPGDLQVLSAESEEATTAFLTTINAIIHHSRQKHYPALDELLNRLVASPGYAQEITTSKRARNDFFEKILRLDVAPQEFFPSQLIKYCLHPESSIRDAASRLLSEIAITSTDQTVSVIEATQTELWNLATGKNRGYSEISEIVDSFLEPLAQIMRSPSVASEQAKVTFELLRLVSRQADVLCQQGVEKFIQEIYSAVWQQTKKPLAITEVENRPVVFIAPS